MDSHSIEITPKLVDGLYTEAMLLADEARSYFDSDRSRQMSSPELTVALSCESLKVTTRLMHVIAWLLNQKAVRAGELSRSDRSDSLDDLGYAPATDDQLTANLPDEAREIIVASEDLYYRVQRVSGSILRDAKDVPTPHMMIEQIRAAF